MTIAVDFDGTITTRNVYPDIGEFRENAIEVLKALQNQGNDICLWTCRHGESLVAALKALEEKRFKPNYVNCGPFTTGSTKMVANLYIDDAAWPNVLLPEEKRVDWDLIAKSFHLTDEDLNG